MDQGNYSPRLTIILLIALIAGQVLTFNYLKNDIDRQIAECHEAINTSTIMQGALINMLVKKNIIDRDQLLKEAGLLSSNLSKMIQEMKDTKDKAVPQTSGEKK